MERREFYEDGGKNTFNKKAMPPSEVHETPPDQKTPQQLFEERRQVFDIKLAQQDELHR
jgi:hypothetical protein